MGQWLVRSSHSNVREPTGHAERRKLGDAGDEADGAEEQTRGAHLAEVDGLEGVDQRVLPAGEEDVPGTNTFDVAWNAVV